MRDFCGRLIAWIFQIQLLRTTERKCPGMWFYFLVKGCEANPCMNGGTCRQDGNAATCVCKAGLGGLICDKGEWWVGEIKLGGKLADLCYWHLAGWTTEFQNREVVTMTECVLNAMLRPVNCSSILVLALSVEDIRSTDWLFKRTQTPGFNERINIAKWLTCVYICSD